MWYVSCNRWVNKDYPLYDIKFAKSKNLINWFQSSRASIKLKKSERAVARPFVIKNKKNFEMIYSYENRNSTYHLGYASSKDGINWKRNDKNIKLIGNTKI